MGKVTIFKDKAGEWRWHKTEGSDIVADSGEGYKDRSAAVAAAEKEAEQGDELVVEEPE